VCSTETRVRGLQSFHSHLDRESYDGKVRTEVLRRPCRHLPALSWSVGQGAFDGVSVFVGYDADVEEFEDLILLNLNRIPVV